MNEASSSPSDAEKIRERPPLGIPPFAGEGPQFATAAEKPQKNSPAADATRAPPAAFALPGYEILKQIGEGGTATVWQARQRSLDRVVAIKTLDHALVPDQEALARFRQEAQAAARLKHPAIVQVYDAGEEAGRPYLVMEYVGGCTVGDLLRKAGKLTEQNTLLVAEAVAHALAYAWDKDCIIHLDIKPDNVLVETDGTIKVADLGLARFIGVHHKRVDADTILGTPNYVSPEQAEGVPDLDCRTDIYSLGAMMYHMVTGRLPFAGHPGSGAMDAHIGEFLVDPAELNPDLSPGMAWLIEKLMIKNRAYRPAYWSVVLADLAEVKEGRLPKPPLPELGQSTVVRQANRAQPVVKPARAPLRVKEAAAPRKKLVVSGESLAAAAPQRFEEHGIRRALTQLLLTAVGAAAVAIFFALGVPWRVGLRSAAPAPEPPPPVEPVESAAVLVRAVPPQPQSRVVAPPKASPVRVTPPAAQPEDRVEEPGIGEIDWGDGMNPPEASASAPAVMEAGMKDGVVVWENADFKEAARLHNEAIALYKEFQQTRENREQLQGIETMAREAIRKFESVQALAPPDIDVPGYIQQCYHLISDVRLSTLMDENKKPGRPERKALPAPASSVH